MRLRWTVGLLLTACGLCAQSLDQSTLLLLNHAKADKDLFGAGRPGGFSIEGQVRMNNSDLRLSAIEEEWVPPEVADRDLIGTTKGADLFIGRMLRENDIVVTGGISKQISIFNSNKSTIVTDSLLRVEDVLYARRGAAVQSGDLVVVTRRGGRMHIDNHEVRIDVNGFPAFVTGQEYLLFLSLNPSTGSYKVRADGAFLIEGSDMKPLSTIRKHPATPYLQDEQTFLEMIRSRSGEVTQ